LFSPKRLPLRQYSFFQHNTHVPNVVQKKRDLLFPDHKMPIFPEISGKTK